MALEAVSPASAALPELAHLHLLAHLAGVPTEASLSYMIPTRAREGETDRSGKDTDAMLETFRVGSCAVA